MPGPVYKEFSDWKDALTAGCLLLVVLVADAFAAFVVVIVLAVRGLGRLDASVGGGPEPTGPPPTDWTPILGFGAVALAIGVTGILLLWAGLRGIGTVQLVICVVVAAGVLDAWP